MLRFFRTLSTLLLLPLAFAMMATGPAATQAPSASDPDSRLTQHRGSGDYFVSGALGFGSLAEENTGLHGLQKPSRRTSAVPRREAVSRPPSSSSTTPETEITSPPASNTFYVERVADDGDFDPGDGYCNINASGQEGPCTLRAALDEINASSLDSAFVDFSRLSSGSVARFQPSSSELTIENRRTVIMGHTHPDYVKGGQPYVYVDASNLSGSTDDALDVGSDADGSAIAAVGVVNAPDDGISVDGFGSDPVEDVTVQYSWIGVDPDGTAAPNGGNSSDAPSGIDLRNAISSTIGVAETEYSSVFTGEGQNVIAGNDNNNSAGNRTMGIRIRNFSTSDASAASAENEIRGNRIGIAPDGTPLGNGGYGVSIDHGENGQDIENDEETYVEDNHVAGNAAGGLLLRGANGQVLDNTFGTTVDGTQTSAQLAPGETGIAIQNPQDTLIVDNTVGDPNRSSGEANVIGGYDVGIHAGSSAGEANGDHVYGNYLGVTPNGDDIGLESKGILTTAGQGLDITNNVIGNVGTGATKDGGIVMDGAGAFSNVTDNVIGVTPTLTASPIDGSGLYLRGKTGHDVTNNVIGNATRHGIWCLKTNASSYFDVSLQSNDIGETAGDDDIGNGEYGVYVSGDAKDVIVGNDYAADIDQTSTGNRIGNNGAGGVAVVGASTGPIPIRGNTFADNGLANGSSPLPIDLGADGQTANDGATGDADTGPNNLQNWPKITSIDCQSTVSGDELTLKYIVQTASGNADFGGLGVRTDFYVAPQSQAGSALTYLASDTAGAGYETNSIYASGPNLCDKYVVGSVTDASGNTGEFSGTAQKLPVELASFNAILDDASVRLAWRTTAETGNAGFTVQHRGPDADDWTDRQFVEGTGTTDEPQRYSLLVEDLAPGEHTFRLQQRDLDGTTTLSRTVTATVQLDAPYQLQVGPNPVQRRGTVSLVLRESQAVNVVLYDILGRQVSTLHSGRLESGKTTLPLDASSLSSGQYLLRLQAEQFTTTRTVMVTR